MAVVASQQAVPYVADESEVHRLIRHGAPLAAIVAELEANHTVNQRSPCGKSPLMTAGYYCRKDVLLALIDFGAVVNALDERTGDTAAHFVCHSLVGHIRQCSCVMALVEAGADTDIRNNDGYTVAELAEKNGNHDIGNTGHD